MSVKTTVDKVAEAATKVGHRIGEGAEQATDWAKEKLHQAGNRIDEAAQRAKHSAAECDTPVRSKGAIEPKMDVIASCGTRIGRVDHMDGASSIKLAKNDPKSGGQHHWIPTSWVDRVDDHVHLNVNSEEAMAGWKSE